ncbi:hypothetical protein F0562_014072 [Nyssa sinensis]|uniref:Uncharacterized protein n=1 Tax=Nyssa sinensis TaxID=561372 RepID=A0A5J4ZQ55_9ASTE|nr:hypothetical protein F0562_014072 [Nyssa sinensis]
MEDKRAFGMKTKGSSILRKAQEKILLYKTTWWYFESSAQSFLIPASILLELFCLIRRRLFWRMRAAVKKAVRLKSGGKQQLRFQYDPSSYALNFDDGGCNSRERSNAIRQDKIQDLSETTTWVYVLWVQSQ